MRDWYAILSDRIGSDGCCPDCGEWFPTTGEGAADMTCRAARGHISLNVPR